MKNGVHGRFEHMCMNQATWPKPMKFCNNKIWLHSARSSNDLISRTCNKLSELAAMFACVLGLGDVRKLNIWSGIADCLPLSAMHVLDLVNIIKCFWAFTAAFVSVALVLWRVPELWSFDTIFSLTCYSLLFFSDAATKFQEFLCTLVFYKVQARNQGGQQCSCSQENFLKHV